MTGRELMRWCLSQAGLSAVASEGRLIGTGIVREAWGEKDFPWALKGQQVLTMRSWGESNFRSHPPFLKLWCFA